MSVVILGGHERMEHKYKELCREYQCDVKVFTKADGSLRRKLGSPDLMIFFTSTMSHKMVRGAVSGMRGLPTQIEYVPTGSVSALRGILEKYARPAA